MMRLLVYLKPYFFETRYVLASRCKICLPLQGLGISDDKIYDKHVYKLLSTITHYSRTTSNTKSISRKTLEPYME